MTKRITMMSGHKYEVRTAGALQIFVVWILTRRVPPLVLVNKNDDKTYKVPPHIEEQISLVGEKYERCELSRAWSDQDKIHRLRRASAATDLVGHAVEAHLLGDPTSLEELLSDEQHNFAARINAKLNALSKVT